tara:strand:- start:829 stop:936 length:108 start_codon:yes stop_codon:yes gene_type:complete
MGAVFAACQVTLPNWVEKISKIGFSFNPTGAAIAP